MKRKFGKFLSVILVAVTMLQLCAIFVSASESEDANMASYQEKKAFALSQAKNQSTVTDGSTTVTYEWSSGLVTGAMLLVPDTVIDETRKNQFKLANVLANNHGLNDGNDIIDIMYHAFTANLQANLYYPDDYWKNDAYRHFAWNFLSTRDLDVSIETTRIYTTCFEWANELLPDWIQYRDDRLIYYQSIGDSNAQAKAWADANDFAVEAKKYLQMQCLNAHWIFRMAFSEKNGNAYMYSGIMDFWNNKKGCEYASDNIWQTAKNAFDSAVANGDLFVLEPNYNNINSISSRMFLNSWWYVVT